ncbi:hypothetical protein [Rhodococcus maanshanensis]|uniref:Uncharacterized protein n=1 Tax=Rhodococcus maanshanensis TaxID=183556 RepID=A0A1H7W387_9NOCA|nr:hypothetical protein [Rhodococcus maanshanensis]SEM16052.1 hypothetical protein SAMN05444583_12466 [Rhodococcus maanshanensis]
MVGQLVRRGGSVLAALAVVVGGATMGAGVAGGAPGGGFGSSCSGLYEELCGEAFLDHGAKGNILLGYQGPAKAEVGSEVTYYPSFTARDGIPGLAVMSVTHHAPRGFEFVGAEVTSRPRFAADAKLDSTAVVDPVTGDVTVTAPAGGWAIPTSATDAGSLSGSLFVGLRYKVVESYLAGTTGVTFTGTDVPASEGWLATGATRVTSGIGGLGSSGN